jgi:RNA polymerase sigma-70 factor (ECF subfamily)
VETALIPAAQRRDGPVSVEPTDEDLCRRIAEHDTPAFELLVERHQARVFRMASAMLANEADGRDIAQEAFIRLFESAHRFDGRSRFSTWFYRIVVNLCIDHQRHNRWWRKILPLSGATDDSDEALIDPPSDQPGPELEAIRRQTAGNLRELLKQLSPSQRAAVLLHVQEDLSSREIAAVLKCSENTARVHLHRGVTRLMKTLKEN